MENCIKTTKKNTKSDKRTCLSFFIGVVRGKGSTTMGNYLVIVIHIVHRHCYIGFRDLI